MSTLTTLLLTTILFGSGMQRHQSASRIASEDTPVLSQTVQAFRVENSTMEEALRALRQTNLMRILIGFEKVAHRQGEKTESLSLSLNNATIQDILQQLCQQSRQYTFDIINGTVIHVYPVRAQSDPPGLLDLRISDFSVEGKMLPAAVIVRVGELAPELASYLRRRQDEYYARRGMSPGFPGSTFQGNMDPEITLHLRNKTVRDILNATVVYSVQLGDQTPPDQLGGKIPPTSWMYEFIIDPDSPSGLGGTPRWVAF